MLYNWYLLKQNNDFFTYQACLFSSRVNINSILKLLWNELYKNGQQMSYFADKWINFEPFWNYLETFSNPYRESMLSKWVSLSADFLPLQLTKFLFLGSSMFASRVASQRQQEQRYHVQHCPHCLTFSNVKK